MICKIIRNANKYVSGWITRQPEVKEESLTDWLLDYFSQHVKQIWYYQFSRQEEGKFSGADWDWWILLKHGCYKLRIQAKRVKIGNNHYNDLSRSNQNGFQIDHLLESSELYNFYPLYSIYGHSEGVERCNSSAKPILLHICSALEVYNLIFNEPRHKIESRDILELTIPLECLFCCPLVLNAKNYGLKNLFDLYFKISPSYQKNNSISDNPDNKVGFEEKVPEIVSEIIKNKEIIKNTIRLLNEYKSFYKGSNSLCIIDLENRKDLIK